MASRAAAASSAIRSAIGPDPRSNAAPTALGGRDFAAALLTGSGVDAPSAVLVASCFSTFWFLLLVCFSFAATVCGSATYATRCPLEPWPLPHEPDVRGCWV